MVYINKIEEAGKLACGRQDQKGFRVSLNGTEYVGQTFELDGVEGMPNLRGAILNESRIYGKVLITPGSMNEFFRYDAFRTVTEEHRRKTIDILEGIPGDEILKERFGEDPSFDVFMINREEYVSASQILFVGSRFLGKVFGYTHYGVADKEGFANDKPWDTAFLNERQTLDLSVGRNRIQTFFPRDFSDKKEYSIFFEEASRMGENDKIIYNLIGKSILKSAMTKGYIVREKE